MFIDMHADEGIASEVVIEMTGLAVGDTIEDHLLVITDGERRINLL